MKNDSWEKICKSSAVQRKNFMTSTKLALYFYSEKYAHHSWKNKIIIYFQDQCVLLCGCQFQGIMNLITDLTAEKYCQGSQAKNCLFNDDQPQQQAFARKGKGILGTREMRRVNSLLAGISQKLALQTTAQYRHLIKAVLQQSPLIITDSLLCSLEKNA